MTDRLRGPRGQTREGYLAAFKIIFDREKMLWVVTEFVNDHCHKLILGNHNQFLGSYRHVQDCDLSQLQSLRLVGVKTTQVMDHLLDQSGSYAVVGQTKKDLQNRLDFLRRYFGDEMSFDSTYRTNSYNQPLVIFVGLNNHKKTVVFGFGLLVDEKVDTYTWILQTFLEAMHGKCPISVVSDGDRAMSKALMFVMGSAFWYKRLKLYEFRSHIDRAMSRLQNNETKNDFDSINENPVLITHLVQLEKHVAEAFTKNTFQWVQDETKSETTKRKENANDRRTQSRFRVNDPVIAATKRSIKHNKKSSGKARKCGKYGLSGRTAKTCCAHVKYNISAMASNGDARTGFTS
ncbi:hypothetical protein Ddye_012914 [Dipteronia dyeriana]|uniref:MULE transposase domain-containing protein n=1 Tax=Dipteronia dyeriana TaxID=168575 RepID=A0AAD9X564_9ROSI|nr:hypothetical protein Ddye_012914 [Dipteronia dyeriana]